MGILQETARAFGLDLTEVQLERFEQYYRELARWNEQINLTAITEYTQVMIKHFADSLSAALVLPWPFEQTLDGKTLIDVGAGAGLPGVPLAIAFPQLQVALLEATGKKAVFLDELARSLDLTNVVTLRGRAEEIGNKPEHREHYDFAVARAVAELRILAEYTLPFLRVGGTLIAYKSLDAHAETQAAANALATLGGKPRALIPVQLPTVPETRFLVVVDKVAQTPAKYPRAPGRPEKKPL